MMATINYSITKSSVQTDSIIFWPSGLGNDDGWIIGWRLEQIWLVAGIVRCRNNSTVIEFERISNKMDVLRRNTCFCCSCDETTKDYPTGCGGCTRKLCLETIKVLAYSSRNNLPFSKLSNKAHGTLPLLQVSPEKIPLHFTKEGSHSCFSFRQVVLYDSCLTGSPPQKEQRLQDIVLFSNPNPNSSFSQEVLGRITHASAVIQAVLLPESSTLPFDCVDQSTEEEVLEGCFGFVQRVAFLVPIQSYFVEHVHRETSLVQMLRAFANASKAKAPCTSPMHCGKCKKRYQTLTQSHHADIDQAICRFNAAVRRAVDLTIGFSAGLVLSLIERNWSTSFHFTKVVQRQFDGLRMLLAWMETFPIGFKLNVKLTVAMGKAARAFLVVHEVFVYKLLTAGIYLLKTPFLPLLFGLLVGGSGMLTLLCDMWRLVTLHFSGLAHAFHLLFSVEVFVLRSSWRLFRGKKRNILRQRTDTMNYDSTQLLFGTILFTAALFLFTTVLVYDVVFSSLHYLVLFITRLLLAVFFMVYRFRWGSIWLHLSVSNWFAVGVHLMDGSQRQQGRPVNDGVLTFLVPERMSMSALIKHAILRKK